MCVIGIDFASIFSSFAIGFLNFSDSVVFFVFNYIYKFIHFVISGDKGDPGMQGEH
jgi:hypothetical protein